MSRVQLAISGLTGSMLKLSDKDADSPKAKALSNALTEREKDMAALRGHIQNLQNENEELRKGLETVFQLLRQMPGSQVARSEVGQLIELCLNEKMHTRGLVENCDVLLQHPVLSERREGQAPAATVRPSGDLCDEASPGSTSETAESASQNGEGASEKTSPEELQHLRRELQESQRQEDELLTEMSSMGKELRELKKKSRGGADESRLKELERKLSSLRRRVLVVDDDRQVLKLLRQILESTGLVAVDVAQEPLEAIGTLKSGEALPDLIILDIGMPGIRGTDFCAALERNRKTRHIPVIFHSATLPENVSELNNLYHVSYIQKPARNKDIEATVLQALGFGFKGRGSTGS